MFSKILFAFLSLYALTSTSTARFPTHGVAYNLGERLDVSDISTENSGDLVTENEKDDFLFSNSGSRVEQPGFSVRTCSRTLVTPEFVAFFSIRAPPLHST